MKKGEAVVFTDGAAKGNPGPGGWGAIVLLVGGRVVEFGGAEDHTTNNRMEMTAAIAALEFLAAEALDDHVLIFADSSYVIDGATKWVAAWKRRGWKKADGNGVLNRDLWERLAALCSVRTRRRLLSWKRVRGHAGVLGNERADEIASELALGNDVDLYDGPASGYRYDPAELVRDAEADCSGGDRRRAADKPGVGGGGRPATGKPCGGTGAGGSSTKPAAPARKGKPHSYLCVVDGVARRHPTWPECEALVKGRSGARFKKAMTAAEEAEILSSWGVSLTKT